MEESTSDQLNLPYEFGDLSSVNSVWLTLTNKCNIHCKYCFNYVYNDHEDMNDDLAVSIIKKHIEAQDKSKNKKFHLVYFGGEPTINQAALFKTIDFIEENNIDSRLNLLTNGIVSENVVNKLVTKSLIYQISLDGNNNNLRFYKNSTKSADNQTLHFIEKIRKENFSAPIKIRATIHEGNVANMVDLIELCNEYSITAISFAPICLFGDSLNHSIKQPLINDYIDHLQKAAALSKKYNIHVDLKDAQYFNEFANKKMIVPFVWLPDGQVAMSITYASSKIPAANSIIIGEYNALSNSVMLNNDFIQKMNRNFIKNRARYCKDCPIVEKCRGTIHFTPFATNTFIEQRDRYFCEVAVKIYNIFPVRS